MHSRHWTEHRTSPPRWRYIWCELKSELNFGNPKNLMSRFVVYIADILTFLAVVRPMCQPPSKSPWTDGQTDAGNRLEHLSLKMWHLVEIILMNFLIINWPNFVYLLVDPGFKNFTPLKFRWSIAVRSPRRMDAPDRHNGQRDKRTNERTDGRTSVCLLDGVWHYLGALENTSNTLIRFNCNLKCQKTLS